MDNFTHSLTGWALGQTGLKRKSRKGLAALVLGANMPDVDVLFGWVAWAPLATHRGVTHSLVGGVALMPPMLAGLLWLLDRWQVRRGATFASGLPMHFGWLVVLAYIGTLSHPLLDWQNSYAVQLLSPFSNLWFHNDTLFIVDVWVWSGLAFAIWLSRRRERRGGQHWRRPALAAIAGLVAYICANGVLTGLAKSSTVDVIDRRPPQTIFATPAPALFWRRDLVWRTDGLISFGEYSPFGGLASITDPMADGMNDPLVPRAMAANANVIDFMRWSVMTTAEVRRERCRASVRFGDARFAGRASSRFSHEVDLALEGTGCPPAASD